MKRALIGWSRHCGSSVADAGVPRHRLERELVLPRSFRTRFYASTGETSTTPNASKSSSTETSPSDESRVLVDVDHQGVARVCLNRPTKLNALDMPMFDAVADTALSLQKDRAIRAVILSGSGRAFSAGLDVASVLSTNPLKNSERLLTRDDVDDNNNTNNYSNERRSIANLAQRVSMAWRDIPAPVVACLHGECFGGGLQIALGADVRLATPDCRLAIMEAKWGLIPDMGASVLLRELVRIDVAKELTMTGRIVDGNEAAALGLVTRVVDDPLEQAETLVQAFLQRSPDSLAATKQLYHQTWVAPEEYSLKVETALQRKLLVSWNQMAAAGRRFGWKVPYFQRKDGTLDTEKKL